jgi:hypothetical protein
VLITLFAVLMILWLVGLIASFTVGGFIHVLLVLALISLIFDIATGGHALAILRRRA